MIKLAQILQPRDYEALKLVFPSLNLDRVEIRYSTESDGPLGKMAWVKGTIFGYPPIIYLDPADFQPGLLVDPNSDQALVLCHELHHLVQAQSFWYRIKMWWWRLTKSYEDRDHEKDAHSKDDFLLQMWKDALR